MPADVREYTDCYDVIEKQLFAQLGTSSSTGTGGSGSSSGGSVLPTWLIVVIVVLALAALTFGALAIRRRRLETTEDRGRPMRVADPTRRARARRTGRAPAGTPRRSWPPGAGELTIRAVRPRPRGLTAHRSNLPT